MTQSNLAPVLLLGIVNTGITCRIEQVQAAPVGRFGGAASRMAGISVSHNPIMNW